MLSARKSVMAFHLHSAFVGPNNIVEGVMKMLSCPSQSLALVHFAYQLAIRAASKGPAQSRPASKDSLQTDQISFLDLRDGAISEQLSRHRTSSDHLQSTLSPLLI